MGESWIFEGGTSRLSSRLNSFPSVREERIRTSVEKSLQLFLLVISFLRSKQGVRPCFQLSIKSEEDIPLSVMQEALLSEIFNCKSVS